MKKNSSLSFLLVSGLLGMLLVMGCTGNRKRITSNGLHHLQLGDPLPPAGIDHLRGHGVRDTFVEQGDYQWREVVMDYRKGKVPNTLDFS